MFSEHKLTAIHFWATWCTECIEELPEIDQAVERYAKHGFQLMPLAMENNVQRIREFMKKHNLTRIQPHRDHRALIFNHYNVRGLPTTVFVNQKGEEVGRAEGPMHWDSAENAAFIQRHLQ